MLDPRDKELSVLIESLNMDEAERTGKPIDNGKSFWIGDEFREMAFMHGGGDETSYEEDLEVRNYSNDFHTLREDPKLNTKKMIQNSFPHTMRKNLTWLNRAAEPRPRRNGGKGWDVALVNMTYGKYQPFGILEHWTLFRMPICPALTAGYLEEGALWRPSSPYCLGDNTNPEPII
jgi:hypothetical protein